MILKNIFSKAVDRPIEGVIKADDEASLRLEIEEYVLTNEVSKRLENFLQAYNKYEGANGVWVSGFFGSGKSHLLKILALLLENREIDGAKTLDLFMPKCEDNEFLIGDLKRAVSIPSKSILFNIDQKADVISKTQVDALLAVFVKVFDEMSGYYGKQGHIAQFERDLDDRGCYEQFKSAYKSVAGKTWETGREQALLEGKNIAKAYAQVTDTEEALVTGILDKYRTQYKVSIEDFAEQVNRYIQCQGLNFRLNFFVDEVGQYIAENVKLMTNLQTIAESLATKCRGRAWVIVTAQEEMETVVGEMTKQQGNDFSKIQARFANRMKLTSADVAEVIQKRLLNKTHEGLIVLSDIYNAQLNNFKTLFDFTDGSQTYQNFQDVEHFRLSYPFIPYQFSLFQAAIQSLSLHNAFEGRHSSVGERSMLGVFQQVAIKIGDHKLGQLATFDLMFEGIRTALKSNIQRAIIHAENHLNAPFALRLLKALFLVKYVKEFKSTARNLSVLMVDSFNQDLSELRKRIEETLDLLEQQIYIQRNGDLYEYLTDEEKDIEQEIKHTDVDTADFASELETIIFDQIIKIKKIRYSENGQDYAFSRKLDDRLYGREQELSIHVISPFYDRYEDLAILRASTMAKDELLVIIPNDVRLVSDMQMYKRTDKYIRQNIMLAQSSSIKRILEEKSYQNRERYADLQRRLQSLMGNAQMIVAAAEVESASEDPQSRIYQGFCQLISRTYPNLRMLRNIAYVENDISNYLKLSQQGLLNKDDHNDATSTSEPELELFAFIQGNNFNGLRTTIKNLLEHFQRKPYGWDYPAILCTLAKLCARGKIEVRSDGNVLEGDELERALRYTHGHGNVILVPQLQFTASQIRELKEFYEDFFEAPPQSGEARALANETKKAFTQLIQKLKEYITQIGQYSFLEALNPVLEKLTIVGSKSYDWYLNDLTKQEDQLLEMKENVIDPITRFMSGPQKEIFDKAQSFLQNQDANLSYIKEKTANDSWKVGETDSKTITLEDLKEALVDPQCFKGNRMQKIKVQVEALENQVTELIEVEVIKAKKTIDDLKNRLSGMSEFNILKSKQQEQLVQPFNDFTATIQNQKLIALIRDSLRRFEENDYQKLLSKLASWAQPAPTSESVSQPEQSIISDENVQPTTPTKSEPTIEYVSSRSVKVSFNKAWLADENDVEQYIESMRKALLDEIRKGKRIQI